LSNGTRRFAKYKEMMRKKAGLSGILLFVSVLLLLSCDKSEKLYSHTFFRMDTITEITIRNSKDVDPRKVWIAADSLLKDREERFSITSAGSEILKLNTRKTNTVHVSKELGDMIATGIHFGDMLGGDFDITILPIKELWGFGEKSGGDSPLPSPEQVKETLKKVDYRKVKINHTHDTVYFASPDVRIDVGGIAKEYVMEDLGGLLDGFGLTDYLISAGGDIYAKGGHLDGKPWKIGIQHPRNRDSVLAVLDLDKRATMTSGDYERYRIVNRKRYCHIFDSHTGYSAEKNRSVTIGADSPTRIPSAGLFCRDAKDILSYVNAHKDLQCVVVDYNGKVYVSEGWKNKVKLRQP
jgi:thiamine biosynthesis lipoprotein